VADPNMEDYGAEGYEDYGYEGADNSYDGTMVDSAAMGADGNKEVEAWVADALYKDESTGDWCCKYCSKTNRNRARVSRHAEVHFPGTVPLPCNFCGKTFKTRNSLASHVSRWHRQEDSHAKNFDHNFV